MVQGSAARPRRGLLILPIVLLAIDEAAFVVVAPVQAHELAAAEIAVGEGAVGGVVEALFLTIDAGDLAVGQGSVGDAGVGAGVLAGLAGIELVGAPGRAGVGRSR